MNTLLAPSKSELLRRWMRERGVFRTHEIIAFGLSLQWTRAQREKGALHAKGIIRELTKEEKLLRGLTTKEGCYCWVGENIYDPVHAR